MAALFGGVLKKKTADGGEAIVPGLAKEVKTSAHE